MTIAEKILATKSGKTAVTPGEIVEAYPDLVMSHTATWRSASVMQRIGATKLYDPDRLAIVLDHISPAKTEKYAADQQTSRNFARNNGVTKFYDVDAGIAHLVLMEAGHVVPGDLIVGTDSHCTIYGSLGALGTGIGYTEVASVWITGKLWLKVPESIRIILDGRFPAGVYSKDLMLHLIGKLGADGCGYKSVEFYGGAVSDLSVSERMTMTNLAMEMGVKCAFFPPDEKTAEYLKGNSMTRAAIAPSWLMRTPFTSRTFRWTSRSLSLWSRVRMKSKIRSQSGKWPGRILIRYSWAPAPMRSTKIWQWRPEFSKAAAFTPACG